MQQGIAAPLKSRIALLALAYAIFVIYGSLVPLDVNGISFTQALNDFAQLNKTDFVIDPNKRADWFTNFLLMTPLFVLMMLLITHKGFGVVSLLYAGIVTGLIALISIGIEFTQLFIDKRISSFKDLYAQLFGIAAILPIYYVLRSKIHALLLQISSRDAGDKWQVYGVVMITVLFVYSLMPFDLSLSMTELTKKWADGRISTIPFYDIYRHPFSGSLSVLVDLAIWTAISFCFMKSKAYQPHKGPINLMLVAVAIELAQLPVLSRYTDITDILVAFAGILLARRVFAKLTGNAISEASPGEGLAASRSMLSYLVLAYFVYFIVLLSFSSFPVELVNRGQFEDKLANFISLPFAAYWADEPFTAITQLLRKTVLFIPLGILLGFYRAASKASTVHFTFVLGLTMALTLSLELVQLLMANKVASISDTALNVLGLYLGLALFRFHSKKENSQSSHQEVSVQTSSTSLNAQTFITLSPQSIAGICIALLLLISTVLWTLLSLDATPYNVKELFDEFPKPVSAVMVATLILLMLGSPLYTLAISKRTGLLSANAMLLHYFALASFFTVLSVMIFPNEALWDVVGYPKLTWLAQSLEVGLRFFALSAPFIFIIYSASCIHLIDGDVKASVNLKLVLAFVMILLILPLSFFVVVAGAVTDNLTELMRNEGYSFGLLGFIAYPLVLMFAASYAAKHVFVKNLETKSIQLVPTIGALLLLLASGPLSHWLLSFGFADIVFKYNSLFTPLQFLLSPDRKNLYSSDEVYFVFLGLHYVLSVIMLSILLLQRAALFRLPIHQASAQGQNAY